MEENPKTLSSILRYRQKRNTVGRFLAIRRREIGLTQGGLGRKMGIRQDKISRWESGEKTVPISAIPALSRALKISDVEIRKTMVRADIQEALFRYGFHEMNSQNYIVKIVKRKKND